MREDINVRHVKRRAKCQWIQGQVERANQTNKWMIGSMLMTLNTPGKWTLVIENATYSYNTMRDSTTGKTPIILLFGLPINEIIQEDLVTALNDQQIGNMAVELLLDTREESPSDTLNPRNLIFLLPEEFEEGFEEINPAISEEYTRMRNETKLYTQRATDRMVVRSMWRNNYLQFQHGSSVLIRPGVDKNEPTKRRGLYEHLNTKVYIVDSILKLNKVRL
ncbi:hypothetical protein DMUE_3502 [Dictyocoela muelleri]|nr:hypothetical protein DMUE_3502 [Dictyocoela muelleri]